VRSQNDGRSEADSERRKAGVRARPVESHILLLCATTAVNLESPTSDNLLLAPVVLIQPGQRRYVVSYQRLGDCLLPSNLKHLRRIVEAIAPAIEASSAAPAGQS